MKKIMAGIAVASVLTANAFADEVYMFLDASTSMKPVESLVKKEATEIKGEMERLGYKVKMFTFGESIKELKSLNGYKADEGSTDYINMIDFVQTKGPGKPVYVLTDGRIPKSMLKEMGLLRNKLKELNDNGDIVCISSMMKKNDFLEKLGFVIKPVGHAKELVSSCMNAWKQIYGEKENNGSGIKKVKNENKKVLVLPESKNTSIEMIIKVK